MSTAQETHHVADDAAAIGRYYQTARAMAENHVQMLALFGVGPHAAAISASHVISIALSGMAEDDPDAARALVDELAAGLLKFSETLGRAEANA